MIETENLLKKIFYQLPKYFVLNIARSFWFVPAILSISALFAAILLNALDRFLLLDPNGMLGWIFSNSPEGARSLLSIIAGSMITVTGVLLSAIIVVMTLASQQYGPRLVQNFIEDRVSQTVTGCFVGCFIYSVVTLKAIQVEPQPFIPHLTLLGALLFTILCMALMLFFVHHVSSAIQVQAIMRRVYLRLDLEIETLFPEGVGETRPPSKHTDPSIIETAKSERKHSTNITVTRSGYLQSIEHDALLELAEEHDLLILFETQPGDFLINGATIVEVRSAQPIDEALSNQIHHQFLIGTLPNCTQDILFPVRQLEEIAIRALSPGINDPRTAIEAIDYLASGLVKLVERKQPSDLRFGSSKQLRMLTQSPDFKDILVQAYRQIHHYGQTDVSIIEKLFSSLKTIRQRAPEDSEKSAVIAQFKDQLYQKSQTSITTECDRQLLQAVHVSTDLHSR